MSYKDRKPMCPCGRPAFREHSGSGICERCYELEQRYYDNVNHDSRRGIVHKKRKTANRRSKYIDAFTTASTGGKTDKHHTDWWDDDALETME